MLHLFSMQVELYITDLLYRYECVIIPGLGAFLTQNRSASIDRKNNNFHPPGKRLSFNKQLQTNDGLLANYISQVEKSSYEEALQNIRNFTRNAKEELQAGNQIAIKNVGDLSLNSQGAIVFEPNTGINYQTESFGLSSFISAEIIRQKEKASPQKQVIILNDREKLHTPFLKYAAVGLLALGLSGFGGMYFYSSQVENHNMAEKQKANQLVENKIQQATFIMDSPLPSLTISVKKEYGKYHVIAGAFRMEENAVTKTQELKEKGFPARTIGESKYGLHQVVYGSHEQKETALQQLREVKISENPDAWLLVQDLSPIYDQE